MAETDLTFGSVPPLYREVYEILCPNREHVDHDMFVEMLVKTSLPKATLTQIWDAVETKQGTLTRNGLYKAMALIALAQQGKTVNEKLLETFQGQELPKPVLGELSELKNLSLVLRRKKAPNVLGLTYTDLCQIDSIKVELVPEKKGLLIKHVEYEVSSRQLKSTVLRRYNDFVAFQEMLLLKYPYRMIPRLPPKRMMNTSHEFIQQRRKCLKRFLHLVVRHPVLTHDPIVKYFLTFNGTDMQHKIKEHFRGTPDEFMTSEVALKAKDFVPMDTQTQFGHSRDHLLRVLMTSVGNLKDISERLVLRAVSYAQDMTQLGRELALMSNDSTPVTNWACGTSNTWHQFQTGFKRLSVEYGLLSDPSSTQASRASEGVVETFNLFLDLLNSYKDLCERHEKGVLQDHQRALQKLGNYKKKKMSATVQSNVTEGPTVEQLEHRILQQESEISNMENRNYFSLHCVHMETQLIHANMESVHIALLKMAEEESLAHVELAGVWNKIQPLVDGLLQPEVRNGSATVSPSPRNISPLPAHLLSNST